jgi:Uma2 family endonuclease
MILMFTVDLPALTPAAVAARWRSLGSVMPQDGRPEMDQFGELFVSPLPTNRHQLLASHVGRQMERQLGGESVSALAINTRIGVRVPDVCWTLQPRRFIDDPASSAPEICVEVVSPSNTEKWLLEKAAAYLEAGAREVIIVELNGRFRFFDATGERSTSAFGLQLVPGY